MRATTEAVQTRTGLGVPAPLEVGRGRPALLGAAVSGVNPGVHAKGSTPVVGPVRVTRTRPLSRSPSGDRRNVQYTPPSTTRRFSQPKEVTLTFASEIV